MDKDILINNEIISDDDNKIDHRKLFRMFPFLKDKQKLKELKIDIESLHYISFRDHAQKITQIIKQHLSKLNLDWYSIVITDCTAGVGGNTLSFAHNFKFVNAIEIDETRCQYLKNNLKIYDLNNVQIFNVDCTSVLDKIRDQNVIFLDIPWGKFYKKYDILRLNFGKQSIENFCLDLMNPKIMKKIPSLVVLKLPKNYDITYFYKIINAHNKEIYYYDLRKMIILVIKV